jgi:hypothetical protein
MADKITIYYSQRRNVERCFGPICLVCHATKAEAARSLASRPGSMSVHPKPEAAVNYAIQ